ncbi:glycosyltransferase [Acinetobacter sp. 99]|uniref:glycosyltransferase n=1 Tax=Acinetobacter sp. 99 TaxID=3098765 RepID=UPI00300A6E96
MIKLNFVVHTYDKRDRGGVLRVVSDLANYLSLDQDFEINIISVGVIHEKAFPINENVNLISLNLEKYNTGFYQGFEKIKWFYDTLTIMTNFVSLKNDSKTIWITSSPPISLLFSILKIKYELKVVGCDHTSTAYKKNRLVQIVRNKLLTKLDVMVALTPQDQEYYNHNNINSVYIPNGIVTQEIKKTENSRKYILYVGRFNEEKQPLEAIRLFMENQVYDLGFKLRVFGHGDQEQEVLNYIQLKGYSKHVEVIVGETNPDIIYKDAYALLMTSKIEGFGMVLLEAIVRGIPCIALDCPYGPRNIIKKQINGYLLNSLSNHDFTVAIKAIDTIDVSRISESISQYNIENVVMEWKKLFKKIVF